MNAYLELDAVGLAQLVHTGEVTPGELLDCAIERAEAVNPALNAIVHRFDDLARSQIDAGRGMDGPLAGVPFLLKDLGADYAGAPLTNGSRSWAGNISDATAYLVERYLDAGLVPFGRTNSPEFGLASTTENVIHGPARNPWNRERSTGGSSGGAGAAVAAGIVPVAHASDGGGSIRIPAAANGLVGLKPTRARTPSGPPAGEGWAGLSIHHVVSRTVRSNAAVLDASHGVAPGGPYDAPAPTGTFAEAVVRTPGTLRIGWAPHLRPAIDNAPDVTEALEQTVAQLEELGHEVTECSFEHLDWDAFSTAFGIITTAGVHRDIRLRAAATGVEPSPDILEPMALLSYERGPSISADDYLGAIETVHATGRATATLWHDIDVLVTPTLPSTAPPLGTLVGPIETVAEWGPRLMALTAFTGIFNATGQPAISLPLAESSAGLPIGMQFVGSFGDDATLFSLAGQLEEAMPWSNRRPSI